MPMPKEEFLIAMRYLAASVSVISAKNSSNKPFAMTVSSVTSLSIDPPSILVCVNKEASIHDILRNGSDLCINILTNDQRDISNLCSSKDLESSRFANDFWDQAGFPYLKNAQANIFCKIDELISYHSHSIVIARVESANSSDSFNTLMYADGGYLD
ncbi:MAG: flavin reductase family protein [SAR86 cluster bacterium]|jgi:flavin reductase (DIM6/NTAB) family NADH-FMN oxidoreductase RutF|nr:flavin reductase family protein [Gammaproteobacteria bacterium]MDB4043817.1 flavin reductase family protein [Gammaproteobacteria bacterium]MDG0966672.1 flavin reductase family protein [SAR86 cluster bacterium]MDG2347491.1 flavin reductase family protein [SAR86 cluster bacterium]|tara:strand:- start:2258 stop:2728 length:471 start_codon:yes stop_codon:yes gene_type:complete